MHEHSFRLWLFTLSNAGLFSIRLWALVTFKWSSVEVFVEDNGYLNCIYEPLRVHFLQHVTQIDRKLFTYMYMSVYIRLICFSKRSGQLSVLFYGYFLNTTNQTVCIDPEYCIHFHRIPDSKVPGAKMGPIWGREDPNRPHGDPMNFAIWDMAVKRDWMTLYYDISYWINVICIYDGE